MKQCFHRKREKTLLHADPKAPPPTPASPKQVLDWGLQLAGAAALQGLPSTHPWGRSLCLLGPGPTQSPESREAALVVSTQV